MFTINSRLLCLITFLITVALISFALYLQYMQNLSPCPLCMLQRIVFILIGLIAIIAYIHNPLIYGFRKYAIINSIMAIGGMALAGRHIWLEHLPPDQVPTCGPDLAVILQYLPIFEALKTAIMGSGSCVKIDWTMFGLSIADWSFISFAILLLINLNIAFRPVGRF